MSTTAQTDANRRNASKSTGPCSAEGEAASSQNALKTGIDAQSLVIRGENLSTFEALAARYQDRFQPVTPEQSVLVDALTSADWFLRRLRKVESQIWEREFKDAKTFSRYNKNILLGDAFGHANHQFNRLQRRLDSMERSYRHALESLRALRPDCFEPSSPTPAASPKPVTSFPPAETGFVPQTEPSPPAAPEAPGHPTAAHSPARQEGSLNP